MKFPQGTILGVARRLGDDRFVFVASYDFIGRLKPNTTQLYGPVQPDGSDSYGDFWTLDGSCIGKADTFEWAPEKEVAKILKAPVETPHPAAILDVLLRQGVITEEQVIGARAYLKLKESS